MVNVVKILEYLDKNEIDFRIESNFCCSFIFYFLDGSVYPRRYYDGVLEGKAMEIIAETVDHVIERAVSNELVKDWRHRIEEGTLVDLFNSVEKYLIEKYNYNVSEPKFRLTSDHVIYFKCKSELLKKGNVYTLAGLKLSAFGNTSPFYYKGEIVRLPNSILEEYNFDY